MANTLQLDVVASLALQLLGQSADVAAVKYSVLDSGRAAGGQQYLLIPNLADEVPISLNGLVVVSDLMLVSDFAVGLTVSSDVIRPSSHLTSASASASASPSAEVTAVVYGKVFLLSGAAITSVALSNGSGHDAHVQIVLAGS